MFSLFLLMSYLKKEINLQSFTLKTLPKKYTPYFYGMEGVVTKQRGGGDFKKKKKREGRRWIRLLQPINKLSNTFELIWVSWIGA